ncbi:MAG: glycosyltransferase [Anaerolineae bacterium]
MAVDDRRRPAASRGRGAGRRAEHARRVCRRVSFAALLAAYAAADLFVSSSAVDNQPNTLLEASALGLPIVATAVGGVPETVHDGVDALLAPPDDPAALAQAILRLLREPGVAERFSQAAIVNA